MERWLRLDPLREEEDAILAAEATTRQKPLKLGARTQKTLRGPRTCVENPHGVKRGFLERP